MTKHRSWWGWGTDEGALSAAEIDRLGQRLAAQFPGHPLERLDPPDVRAVSLPPPRVVPPAALAPLVSDEPEDRARHSKGSGFRDVVRCLAGRVDHPTDLVARPRTEADVVALLDWCGEADIAVIPFGGGTSVVGGVEPRVGERYRGAVTMDLEGLRRMVELDTTSLAARFEGGILGPQLEDELRPHGLTLRHFPQSFEFSTLGGWIATRAGGHFATGPTHIDDLVESMRVITPAGVIETRRLPGSGAGPSPDRLFLGSEGTLGVVIDAWVRVRPRPRWRGGGPVEFGAFASGVEAVRALAQSGLQPSNCRLIDPVEAIVNGAGDGSAAILIVGFESADQPVDAATARAKEIVVGCGGRVDPAWGARADAQASGPESATSDSAGAWRQSFLRAPYLRDGLTRLGMVTETFETAITWDRFDHLYSSVTRAVNTAIGELGMAGGFVTCRFTHAYPDGPAPYFTVIAPATRGGALEQWDAIKTAASDAVLAAGGTITHHHAVGRDHRPWYDRQRPELFAEALRAAKGVLDPSGILNPGVLFDPLF